MLHFSIEPELLDVNVHPTKMELRFRDGELIYQTVYQAVSGALAHKELIPEVELIKRVEEKPVFAARKHEPAPEPFEKRRIMAMQQAATEEKQEGGSLFPKRLVPPKPSFVREGNDLLENWLKPESGSSEKEGFQKLSGSVPAKPGGELSSEPSSEPVIDPAADSGESSLSVKEEKPEQLDLFDGKLLEPKARTMHKLIGQLFDTYWLVEFNGQLYIIDQHAAHEKVLYEKTMATLKTREYSSQLVSPPIILTLNRNEEVLLTQHLKYFTDIGFEIEPFGGKEYAVRGVPANLFSIAKKELLIEMIDGLSEEGFSHNPDVIYEKVASMSCKAAVKGGHKLSAAEANQLIDQLLSLENPYACPHGRPTIISMSKYELEKKFKRIV